MAKAAVRHKDDDEDVKTDPKAPAGARRNPNPNTPDVPPTGVVLGPLPEGQPQSDVVVVEPHLVSDVAPGFTAGAIPGAGSIASIKTDTPTYGTETPPRQTPPTAIGGTASDSAQKHPPPSAHDANGAKIVSAAPTCSGISPTTGTAGPGAAIVVTLTGTNFDRATYATVDGVPQSQSAYVSATSMTVSIDPKYYTAGAHQITAKNSAGESVQRALTLS